MFACRHAFFPKKFFSCDTRLRRILYRMYIRTHAMHVGKSNHAFKRNVIFELVHLLGRVVPLPWKKCTGFLFFSADQAKKRDDDDDDDDTGESGEKICFLSSYLTFCLFLGWWWWRKKVPIPSCVYVSLLRTHMLFGGDGGGWWTWLFSVRSLTLFFSLSVIAWQKKRAAGAAATEK